MTTKTLPPLALVPHLLKGFLEWFYANEIGKIHVQVTKALVQCPELTKDWEWDIIKLNLGMDATRDLIIDDTGVSFSCYKNGAPVNVFFPIHALVLIELPLNDVHSYGFWFQDLIGIGQRNETPVTITCHESPNINLDELSPKLREDISTAVVWGTPVPPPRPKSASTLKVIK